MAENIEASLELYKDGGYSMTFYLNLRALCTLQVTFQFTCASRLRAVPKFL